MKQLLNILMLVILVSSFSAEAGMFGKEEWEKEDCPKNHSLAWCLADYQGRSKGMLDLTQEQFIAKLKAAGISDEHEIANILETSLGVGAGIGNFAMGNLFGGGVFVLHALMPDAVEQNRSNQYVVFLDEKTGRTKKEMADDFNNHILKAIEEAIKSLPDGITANEVNLQNNGRHVKYFRLSISGKECANDNNCFIGSAQKDTVMSEHPRNLPSYLGKVPVVSSIEGSSVGISFSPPEGVNRGQLAKLISAKLPPWMYWYIPAGYLGGNPLPMMLNQGKALFFVKPKESDPAPIMPHLTITK